MRGSHGQGEALRQAVDAEVFALLDTNGDGAISAAEHSAGDKRAIHRTARKPAMFKHLDENGDGALELSELSGPVERLRAADTDGDGTVTRVEMRDRVMARRGDQPG